MKTQHLSDQRIQEYVLSKSNEQSVMDHLQECDICKVKAEVYQNIITGIKEQAHAEFDFNLSEVVLHKLEQKEATSSTLFWLFSLLGIGVVITTVFLFGKYIAKLFAGLSEMAMYLVVTTAVMLLLFQGRDIVRKYKKQMDAVNFG